MLIDLDWRTRDSKVCPGVRYKIRPLKTWAFQELMTFWLGVDQDAEGKISISSTKGLELMQVAEKVFPDHLKEIENLSIKIEGVERSVEPKDLFAESAFVTFAGEIMGELTAISQLGAEDEKNSARPPDKHSVVQESGTPAV